MPHTMERPNEFPELPKVILFDKDDTLSYLGSGPAPKILAMLDGLLRSKTPIAIVTGGSFDSVYKDYLKPLETHMRSDNCYVLVDGGAEGHVFNDKSREWERAYQEPLTDKEKEKIVSSIDLAVKESPFSSEFLASKIDPRDTKIAFLAIPRDTPKEQKITWCGDDTKMLALKKDLERRLPNCNIHVNRPRQTTELVFTRKGIDKSFAIQWLAKRLGIDAKKMLFIGDGFAEDGNDRQALSSGVRALRTGGPEYTNRIIEKITKSQAQTRES